MTGDARYARLAAADLDWQTSFAVNDPTLLWGSSDVVAAMRELKIEGPALAATLPMVFMPGDDAGQPGAGEVKRAAITFQVVEMQDRAFEVHLFKGCYRKYTDPYRGKVTLYDPDGRTVDRKPVSCEGLQRFALAAPRDGKTGVYTVQVCLEDIWRWTADDLTFELGPGAHRMQVASRYDHEWVDQLVLTPNMAEFPWLGESLSPEAVVFEAENGSGKGFEIGRHADASGGRYARRAGTGRDTRQTFTFRLPPGPRRRYRLFARVWKPRADLLNVWMDDARLVMLKQTHDMDGNTYPIWSVATTLGEKAVVPYWRMGRPGRPGSYITDGLKPVPVGPDAPPP
jgi:hypothetical protein